MPPRRMEVAHRLVPPLALRWLRAEVEGAERIPRDGGLIIASNHRSWIDNYLLSCAATRPLWFLGKASLSEGLFGRFNVWMGMVPIHRGVRDAAAIERLVELVRAGEAVALFPEGTRSPSGQLHRFRSGMTRIAAAGAAPVVPAGLVGTHLLAPRPGRRRPRRPARGAVRVAFGERIAPPRDTPRDRRAFTRRVRDEVAALCGQPLADGFAPVEPDEEG